MARESRSLGDIISDIAYRKQRAGQARFGREATASDAPKDVYAQACAAIGESFVADGFRFTRSGPHFARRSGDFIFKVSFQSSRSNVAGEYVALWIHANVVSPKLKKWRVANRSVRGPYDYVAGAQIGNLARQPAWLEWNLAVPATRQQEIQNAISTIRALAIPYFAEFEDPANICRKLQRGELVGMDLMDMFDFVACFSSIHDARDVATRFLLRRSDLVDGYHERMKHFHQAGLPDHVPSGWIDVLAALSIRFNLGDLASPVVA